MNPGNQPSRRNNSNTDARRALVPYGSISYFTQDGWSDYDSMQLRLNRRFSNGWMLNTNYTASKTAGATLGLIPYNLPQIEDLVNTSGSRHRLVASWVYQLPDIENNGALNAVFGCWQVTGVYQFQSGGWLSIESGTDRSLDGLGGDRAVRVDGVPLEPPAGSDQTIRFNGLAFRQADLGTWGSANAKNIVRNPNATQTNMGIFKNFRFTNDMGMQFRAELFNIFNNVNFGGPNTSVSSGAALKRKNEKGRTNNATRANYGNASVSAAVAQPVAIDEIH
jgi:hypothetical protein